MRERFSCLSRSVRLLSLLSATSVFALFAPAVPGWSQESMVEDGSPAGVDPLAEEDLLDEEELDLIVAPVALYPDSLLTQIFVASTYPLDVVKAARFVEEGAELSGAARTDATEAEDWDPSIQVLAAGFPDTVTRMADDLDWTEELGNAVLAQTDDVLDAVQRQRARALAVGNLESNAAQEIEVTDEAISVLPADPEVVYVPTYDPATTYSTRSVAPAVIDPGSSYSTGDMVATGAIAFGSALLINEIFDDDDDWDDYWRGPSSIDWDDDAFYPRRGVNVDGDVNIDVDRNRNRLDVDRDRNNRLDIDRDRNNRLDIDRDRDRRIGAADRLDRDGRDGKWQPPADRREDARRKLENRDRPEGRGEAARDKVAARTGGSAADGGEARQKLEAAKAKRPATKAEKPRQTALKKAEGSKVKPAAAKERATKSAAKVSKPKAAVKRPAPQAKPKQVSRPKAKAAPKRAAPPKASAFKKSHSGQKAKASKARGGSSHGKKLKRR